MQHKRLLAGLLLVMAAPLAAQETEIVYLSGRGAGTEVDWEFRFAEGRGAGGWTKIKVPSQWEQQGFGTYNYGHDEDKTPDVGFYRHSFDAPESWRGKRVELVFEGVMTDTLATVNGKSAGPRHQGGFTRFSYDVSSLLSYGASNLLEVEVHEVSADASVEDAERQADYWVFGGIYRPVYLTITPPEAIGYWPLDARADGSLRAPVSLRGAAAPAELELRVENLAGEPLGQPLRVRSEGAAAELKGTFAGVAAWNAEEPHLYRAILELRRDGKLLHHDAKTFGFRTVERRDDGFYVNGKRILLKGVNRHVFFPDTGRTSNPERDRADAELIKSLNMNAVRASHYPPDVAFLGACDELGLYVIDELPGWHHAYDDAPGRILVKEMIERDADHPSIILWANGNEGGHNFELAREYARHDPQGRPVIHPKSVLSGIDAWHYPTWKELMERLDPRSWRNRWRGLFGALPIHIATEFQHGLYDGGGGASLADFWAAMRASPLGAGGFLWSFTDEAIARTDRGGELDSAGNYAPDGILGPWREKSGSAAAVAEVFSPVVLVSPVAASSGLEGWDGKLLLENRNDFLDLAAFRLDWRTVEWPLEGPERELEAGSMPLPSAPPGGRASFDFKSGRDARAPSSGDALELRFFGPDGRLVLQKVMPIRSQRLETLNLLASSRGQSFGPPAMDESAQLPNRHPAQRAGQGRGPVPSPDAKGPQLERREGKVFLREGGFAAEFEEKTGALVALHDGEARLPLEAPLPTSRLFDEEGPASPEFLRFVEGEKAVGVDIRYRDPEAFFSWRLDGRGRLRFTYRVLATGKPLPGVFFPLAADRVDSFSWLGVGPSRVWRNRLEGLLGFHRKTRAESATPVWGQEPIFEGTYGPVRRAFFEIDGGKVELLFEQPTFVGVLTPSFPKDADDARAAVLPRDGISLLVEPSPIGTKFDHPDEMGPQGAAPPFEGFFSGSVWFTWTRPR
jgi:hypothetical protein